MQALELPHVQAWKLNFHDVDYTVTVRNVLHCATTQSHYGSLLGLFRLVSVVGDGSNFKLFA